MSDVIASICLIEKEERGVGVGTQRYVVVTRRIRY